MLLEPNYFRTIIGKKQVCSFKNGIFDYLYMHKTQDYKTQSRVVTPINKHFN